ncbi:MAG: hypothetical protein SGJ18_13330 [Pseudomonadota bacterium]|nr:hypothetical protein [Pseudomonadota bacterium]
MISIIFTFLFSSQLFAYVGSSSSEALLRFNAYIETTKDNNVKELIEAHVEHLFGPMGLAKYKAAPKGEHSISKIQKTSMGDGKYRITYAYSGVIVLERGPRTHYEVLLPINLETIYEAGLIKKRNPCTDEHYQEKGDFWYFWSPSRKGCKLIEGTDYQRIDAEIETLPNSESTRPEYELLADKNGVIHISILMGMDEPKLSWDPNESKDINAKNYRKIKKSLIEDFEFVQLKSWSKEQIEQVSPLGSKTPFVEEYEKYYKRSSGQNTKVVVRIFFGATGIDEKSTPFHYFLKDAINNSALMIYDGHSGLGSNLHLLDIEKKHRFRFQPPKKRYQIFFFNSCSSYTYYNAMFFGRKRAQGDPNGTKYLDLLTTGLETPFDGSAAAILELINSVHQWSFRSTKTGYQELARRLSMENLIGVNGDEDNPSFVER